MTDVRSGSNLGNSGVRLCRLKVSVFWPADVARARVSKILQAQLRAAVLQRGPVVCREIEKWRAQPTTSLQLVTNVLLLAVGVVSGY